MSQSSSRASSSVTCLNLDTEIVDLDMATNQRVEGVVR
jgi:hypothetical protein